MSLTDTKLRNTKPNGKTQKLFDGGGLYLEVSPSGRKWWRMKYRFGGKEKRLSFGVYPDVSLSDARIARELARKQLAQDTDPGQHKQTEKAKIAAKSDTFESVSLEWFQKQHQCGCPPIAGLCLAGCARMPSLGLASRQSMKSPLRWCSPVSIALLTEVPPSPLVGS